jgi:hypothetical protein
VVPLDGSKVVVTLFAACMVTTGDRGISSLTRAPHVQLDQNAPAQMQEILTKLVFGLPDVEERAGTVANPAERAIWLRDHVPVASTDAFLGNREIGHFHP